MFNILNYITLNGILSLLLYSIVINTVLVIIEKNNYIHVLMLLISLFVIISLLFIILKLEFIGISFFTIYIGAIIVLFLFVIFLIDIKYFSSVSFDVYYKKTLYNIFLWFFVYILYIILMSEIFADIKYLNYNNISFFLNNRNNFFILNNFLANYNIQNFFKLTNNYEIYSFFFDTWFFMRALGINLYTVHYLSFILITIVLLIAMMGAIIIGDVRQQRIKQQETTLQTMKTFYSSFSNVGLYYINKNKITNIYLNWKQNKDKK